MGKACARCKLKKLRCDGIKPSCSICTKLGLRCETARDKRIDKRRMENGVPEFVFKGSSIKENKQSVANSLRDSGLASNYLVDVSEEDRVHSLNYVVASDDSQLPLLTGMQNFEPLPFDLDFHEFLSNLDYPFGLDLQGSGDGEILPSISQEASTPTQVLIDAVFSDENHTPVAVTRSLVEAIAQSNNRSPDESFLLEVVLTMGALVVAKRDFIKQREHASSSKSLINPKTPLAAAEAYHHFSAASKLQPAILKVPTTTAFRGLALMSTFLSGLSTLETQAEFANQALRVAVSIGLHRRQYQDLEEASGLTIAFWELWCSACLFSSFHGRLPPLSREDITASSVIGGKSATEVEFFSIRIRAAQLHYQIAKSRSTGTSISALDFRTAVAEMQASVASIEDKFPLTIEALRRQELLILELRCWIAQAIMLEGEHDMEQKTALRSVTEAKRVIGDLSSRYIPDTSDKSDVLSSLDWNFTYSIRTATMCAFTAARILKKFIGSVDFLSTEFSPYSLGQKLLNHLLDLMPINKHLLADLDATG